MKQGPEIGQWASVLSGLFWMDGVGGSHNYGADNTSVAMVEQNVKMALRRKRITVEQKLCILDNSFEL